jgi:acetyl esterase/lipase
MDAKDSLEWCRTDLAALLEARSDFGGAKADPNKIVAFGHSAGGTVCLWLVSSPSASSWDYDDPSNNFSFYI